MAATETDGRSSPRPGRWAIVRKFYGYSAVIWLNICLLLVLLNWLARVANSSDSGSNPVVRRHGDVIYDAYPGWERSDVDQLINECYPQPGYLYEPYTQFRERPRRGEHVIVTNHGFRLHRPPGPWPPEPRFFNIFVFGGSTTFGYGQPGEATIPARLQHHLAARLGGRPARTYNFGRGYYFSAQERVLFERLLHDGRIPDLAIFIDGANDTALWKASGGEPRFTSYFRGAANRLGRRNQFSITSPLGSYLRSRKARRPPVLPDAEETDWGEMVDAYFRNLRMTRALGREFDVETLFVWQPAPGYRYATAEHHLLARRVGIATWESSYSTFEAALAAREPDARILNLAGLQENEERNLYVDTVHYNEYFSDRIAAAIAEHLVALERGPDDGAG